MSWYDYVPLAGSIARLAQGDYKQAAIDAVPVIGPGVQYIGNELSQLGDLGFGDKRRGFDQAAQSLTDLSGKQKAFQMQGLNQAEGYYNPASTAINQIYGTPGTFKK